MVVIVAASIAAPIASWAAPMQPEASGLAQTSQQTEYANLESLGKAALTRADYPDARVKFQRCLDIATSLKDKRLECIALGWLGEVASQSGRLPEAQDFFKRSFTIADAIGFDPERVRSLLGTGGVHALLGELTVATQVFARALDAAERVGDQKMLLQCLLNLGNANATLRNSSDALAFFNRALEICENIKDTELRPSVLLGVGIVYGTTGEPEKALEYFSQALKLAQDMGMMQLASDARNNISLVYRMLGRPAEAIKFLTEVLAFEEERGNQQGVAQAVNNLAAAYTDVGRYDDALPLFLRALELKEKVGNQRELTSTLHNIGNTYEALGNYADALRFHKRSLFVAEEQHNALSISEAQNAMGNCYVLLGRLDHAIPAYARGLERAEETKDRLEQIVSFTGLGTCYLEVGQTDLAMDYFMRGLAQAEASGNPMMVASCLSNVGQAYHAMGQADKSLEFLLKSHGILEKFEQRDLISNILGNIGVAYEDLGQFQHAIDAHTKALALTGRDANQSAATSLSALGNVYSRMGQMEKAVDFYKRALEINERIGNERLIGSNLSNAASAYAALGQLDNARSFFERAMTHLESFGSQIADPLRAGAFQAANQRDLYARYANLQIRQGQVPEAIATIERGRARGLGAQLGLDAASFRSVITKEESAAIEAANRNVKEALLLARVARERTESATDAERGYFEVQLAQRLSASENARIKLQLIRDQLFAKYPQLGALSGAAPATKEQLLKLSDGLKDTLILSFSFDQSRLLLIALNANDGPRVIANTARQEAISDSVDGYIKAVAESEEKEARLAKSLYAALLGPVEREGLLNLSAIQRIIVVADGPLLHLPFASLMDGQGRRLIERFAVSSVVSLSSLTWPENVRRPTETLLAVADPTGLGGESTRSASRGGSFAPLPGARKEGIRITREFSGSACLLGSGATEAEVKQLIPSYAILHFACHAYVSGKRALLSALVLAPEKPDSPEDGFLEAGEILDIPLSAQLATLSACQTGQGQQSGGEGLMGLAWAFRAAGVPAIVASKWEVDDTATGRIMATFYDELKKGARKDDALRTAMLKEMKYPQTSGKPRSAESTTSQGKRSNAYYWAAFQVIGDCKPLSPLPKK
jgi:CHAT domain-containing protein/lipopolysaccharide biosynthesis regulator YciM